MTFQIKDIFDLVLIMHLAKHFLQICIAAVLLVDNDAHTKFLFLQEKFPFEGNEM